jgi:hypothetical protein
MYIHFRLSTLGSVRILCTRFRNTCITINSELSPRCYFNMQDMTHTIPPHSQPQPKRPRIQESNSHSAEATNPKCQIRVTERIGGTSSSSADEHKAIAAARVGHQNKLAPYNPTYNPTANQQPSTGDSSSRQTSCESLGSIFDTDQDEEKVSLSNVNNPGLRNRTYAQEQQPHHMCCQHTQPPLAITARQSHAPNAIMEQPDVSLHNSNSPPTNQYELRTRCQPASVHYNDSHNPWWCVMPTSTERLIQIIHVVIFVVILFGLSLVCRDLMYFRS